MKWHPVYQKWAFKRRILRNVHFVSICYTFIYNKYGEFYRLL